MARSRFAWQLFAGWCALVAGIVVACHWLASVELARLADAQQLRRLTDAGGLAALLLPEDPADQAAALVATVPRRADGLAIDVVDADGLPWGGTEGGKEAVGGDRAAAVPGLDPAVLAEVRAGRVASSTRYDAGGGRRIVTVAVPVLRDGRTVGIVRVAAPSSDAELSDGQRRLVWGSLVASAAAVAAGWLVARRAARPLEELATAGRRLADGEAAARLPVSDVGELAVLARALGSMRQQLVERGLQIGRQGSQQEAVLGSMIEGVLAVDARQRIVSLNRAAAELLGIDPGGVVGRPIQEVVRNADLRQFALEAIDRGEPVEDDIVLRAARDRVLRVRGTPLRDATGEGGAVVVVEDITDIRHLENVRRDFVANVSHELKTPVASIKGFVETLLDGRVDDPADRRRFLEIVGRQADRLGLIIEDLLSLSRVEQAEGMGDLPVEPVKVGDLIRTVIAECGPRAEARSIRLDVDCPPDLVAEVNAPLLEQALINLVDNAIKYSEPGHPVRVAGGTAGGVFELAVRDEGAGIAAEHLPRLFERFYRVDKGRSRKIGGTGLGLSIVKHIAQAHGGSVTVESAPGSGSTFRILLPARRG
ncbi:MAG: ATP-binding protein [Planctomycetaceae bacterium]